MTQLFKIKYLLVILFSISALCSSAQRDINHMQVSLQPGLIYTNNNIGSNISDNFSDLESDFYGASLRIQKRLGSAFQIGIEHGEFRQWNNNNTSFRITALSFGYAWDNGNLLGTRSFISPYHTVIVGSSMMEVSSDINFDNSNFLLGTENGLKFRLGDKWSAELALDLFWISDFESADRIFESDFNYGYQAGISYYFGAVKTNYKAPVFNARRTYTPATSVAAEAPPEKEAAAAPKPEPQPEPKSPPANQQLIDDQNRLIENQNKFIDHLLQLELQKEQSARSAPTDSIDYLYYHRFPKGDVPDTEAREDSLTNISKGELKAARDSLIGTNEPDTVLTRVSPEQGEVVEKISSDTVRVDIADTTKVYRNIDSLSAGVSPDVTTDSMDAFFADTMQTTDSIASPAAAPADTVYLIKEVPVDNSDSKRSSSDDSSNSSLEKRMDELEAENEELKEAVEEAKNAESENTETETNTITERVIVQEGEKSQNTFIPVPIPTGGKNKDQKEVLENQKRMEGQIDSLEAKIDDLKTSPPSTAVDSTGINYIVTPSYNYGDIPVGRGAMADSISTDTLKISGSAKKSSIQTPLKPLPESHFVAPLYAMSLSSMKKISDASRMTKPITAQKSKSPETKDKPTSKSEESGNTESEAAANPANFSASYPVKVLFGLNRHELPQEYTDELKKVAKDLNANPGASITVTGYTDKSGDPDYNKALSQKRAQGVRGYLVAQGVPESAITLEAAGHEKATEAYEKEMRKVEVALTR